MINTEGNRYEYEMNVLLNYHKYNILVKEIEIDSIYLDNNANSHFNSLKDSYLIYKNILKYAKKESVDKALKELENDNYQVKGYYPNLNNPLGINEVITNIIDEYKTIDILINNAGISANKKIDDTSYDEFVNIMNLNVNAMFNMIKEVVPYMKENKSGVILNTSSMVSIYGQPSGVGYSTSKFAVNGLTKSLARELAPI